MLTVKDLHVRYGPVEAVRGISFTCDRGEIVTIVGANGAGKSSTLLALAGGLRASVRGDASLDGVPLRRLSPERRVASGLALVPERRRIFGTLTVRENLQVATAVRRDSRASRRDLAELMERFPVLGRFAGRQAGLLSGGEQQQLAIARALLTRPRVLLLDEPSLGLAPRVTDEVFALLGTLRDDGIGVVLVEQNARRAAAVADKALLLHHGRFELADARDDDAAFGRHLGLSAADTED